jgi:Domain of unknown function (DUF5659)
MIRQSPLSKLKPEIPRTRTTRLDVAAFLLVRGFEVSNVEFENATATFLFVDPDRLADSVVKDFYNGGQVSANEYADAQKRVRDLMWEAKRRTPGRN